MQAQFPDPPPTSRLDRILARLGGRTLAIAEFGRDCFRRAVEIEFVDRAVALASLTFTALIPLGVVVGSVLPSTTTDGLAGGLIQRFDLDSASAELVRDLFAPPEAVAGATSVVGLVLLVVAALSFTRALQRVYERSWRLPSLGVRATPSGLLWLAGVVCFVAIFSGIRAQVVDLAGPLLATVVAIGLSTAAWLATPFVLLSRRVAWRRLVPTAIVTAVAMTALSSASVIYMPVAIADSAERYGQIGVAIALVSWFVAAGFALVLSAAVGSVITDRISRRSSPSDRPT